MDSKGDIYVANYGVAISEPYEGRIDIFDPAGRFITEIAEEDIFSDLAVDSEGNLYAVRNGNVVLYTPTSFPPTATTEYIPAATIGPEIVERGIAINPANDHLYVNTPQDAALNRPQDVAEYSSAAEGSGLIDVIGAGSVFNSDGGVAVNSGNGDIYATSTKTDANPTPTKEEPFVSVVKVFSGAAGHPLKETIDGSEIPGLGGFKSSFGELGVAIDQSNGDLYVNDVNGEGLVYQFALDEAGKYRYVSKLEHTFRNVHHAIAFDSGPTSPNQGYVFVTSHLVGIGHLFAFGPKPEEGPPVVSGEAFSSVGTSEAALEGEVNPKGAATHYRFEYVDDANFRNDITESGPGHGFDHALRAPEAMLQAGSAAVPVSQPISGLQPATKYHFRIFAENALGVAEGEREGGEEVEHVFATYPVSSPGLPNGRAYELVTPPDTGGRLPTAIRIGLGDGFESSLTAADGAPNGTDLLFQTTGGALPGSDGSGSGNGDVYRAERGPGGWRTTLAEPTGAQSQLPFSGGFSLDRYSFLTTGGPVNDGLDEGSLVIGGHPTHYLRKPDGSFELIGQGSLGEDPRAVGTWITAGATHVIFTSPVQLESNAPPTPAILPKDSSGTVYDRMPGGPTHVVSLLPGDLAPASAAEIAYQGSSADGTTVAFKVNGTMYVRLHNAETKEVAAGETVFGGLSHDGSRLFYLRVAKVPNKGEIPQGDIFAYDTATAETEAVGNDGKSILVNVSADGSHVYFVSPKVLDEAAEGIAGKDNLYVWDGASIHYVATLGHLDVTGSNEGSNGNGINGGLGLWALYGLGSVTPDGGPANDPSRTTADGSALVFVSRTNLTGYNQEGHSEVYRYDATGESLLCISCNPSLAAAGSDARLESLNVSSDWLAPGTSVAPSANISEDGRMAFFESEDALVPGDVDETQDVYEWEAEGAGGCQRQAGCLSLISSGHSAVANYLYAASPDGHDVFFRSGDQLLRSDVDATPSIYDARIGGGFAEGKPVPCQGEACRGPASAPPPLLAPGSAAFAGSERPRHVRKHHRHKKRHPRKAHRKQGGAR